MSDEMLPMQKRSTPSTKLLPRGLVLLHEDRDILVVDKPAGLLTMGTESETITTYLTENKARFVYSTSDTTKGKLSRTAYEVLKQTKDFALLEVDLLTGRKHQIRVHLAGIGHAVVGDQKYGKRDGAHTRLALHARSISFKHPFSGKQITFETKVPVYFNQLVGSVRAVVL